GAIGSVAKLAVAEGLVFTGKEGTRRFLVANQNLTSGEELATVFAPRQGGWFACFVYADPGHIKDDDKGKLDAPAMLKEMQKNCREANVQRKKSGFPEFEITGWSVPPHYDDASHNLEWGLKLHSDAAESINYEVRLLSRLGFMQTTLVCATEDFEHVLPEFRELLDG